jgi:type I restriction enzyme S subunit
MAEDVLVTKDGTLGVARLVPEGIEEFSIFVSVAMLRPIRTLLLAEYLREFFSTRFYYTQIGYLSAGSGLKHIHLEHFRKFKIPLPSLEEQRHIMDILRDADHSIEEAEACVAKLVNLKVGLMQDLLTCRVPVDALLENEPA